MSVFHGKQGKGAGREARDARYRRAVGRQQLLNDRGWYHRLDNAGVITATPAPAAEFMRAEDRAQDPPPDYRRHARHSRLC